MSSIGIIKTADEVFDSFPRFLSCSVSSALGQFYLQRMKEALHPPVVITVSLSTHTLGELVLPEHVPVLLTRILNSAVRVMDQLGRRLSQGTRLLEGAATKLRLEAVTSCRPHDLPGVKIEQHRQV